MKGTSLIELNEKYKNCPVRTSRYFIDGKEYIAHSRFCGNKDIDEVIFAIAYARAMSDVFKRSNAKVSATPEIKTQT